MARKKAWTGYEDEDFEQNEDIDAEYLAERIAEKEDEGYALPDDEEPEELNFDDD